MPSTTAELMDATLMEVFNQRDPQERAAAIARTYTEEIVFFEAEDVVRGREALHRRVQELLDEAPGFVFTSRGPLREHHGLALQGWGFGPPGAEPVVTGTDVAHLQDGRIHQLHTFLDG